MSQSATSAVPKWYWAVAIVAILWNLLGCVFFATELFAQEQMMETMTEAQKEWVRSVPGWVYVFYGVAVISGVAGSIGLLKRRDWAVPLLTICLASVVVQMGYTMFIAGGLQAMGPSGLIMPAIVVGLAALFWWVGRSARSRSWFQGAAAAA